MISLLAYQIPGQLHRVDCVFLAKVYVFGEEIGDTKFKNAVVTVAHGIKAFNELSFAEEIRILYAGTPENSLGRKLMVDICARYATDDPSWDRELKKCPKAYLLDVLKAMKKVRPEKLCWLWLWPLDQYLEDDNESEAEDNETDRSNA